MTKRMVLDFIKDICDALNKCLIFKENMEFEQFTRDDRTLFAVIRGPGDCRRGCEKYPG